MTIQLKIELVGKVQTLNSLSKERQWLGSHPHEEDAYDAMDEPEDENKLALDQHEQYTSLRDLIVVSPSMRGGQDLEWCDMTELKFKDNLLKLAARAYLQPMGKESTPQMHFLAECWMTFVARNKSLIAGVVESLQRQVDACVKFFRGQTFNLMQLFKPQQQQLGSLQVQRSTARI